MEKHKLYYCEYGVLSNALCKYIHDYKLKLYFDIIRIPAFFIKICDKKYITPCIITTAGTIIDNSRETTKFVENIMEDYAIVDMTPDQLTISI